MIRFLFPFLVAPLVIGNSLPLNLLPASNVSTSSTTLDRKPAAYNTTATSLTTHNDCFDGSQGHLFTASKSDCERALDTLVKGKSLIELHTFGYHPGRRVTDPLPVAAEYGTCEVSLMTFDLEALITLTYAEIYAELLGPDGVLKECLGPQVAAEDALGGQTAMGPRNMLVADVSGLPRKTAGQESKLKIREP